MCIATTLQRHFLPFSNRNFASSPLVESIYLLQIVHILIQQLRLYHLISRCHQISICYSLVHTLFVTTPPPASSIIQLSTQLRNVFLVGWISDCHYWSWKDFVVMERVRHTIIPCYANSFCFVCLLVTFHFIFTLLYGAWILTLIDRMERALHENVYRGLK